MKKRRLKKSVKRNIFVFLLFIVCFILLSGLLTKEEDTVPLTLLTPANEMKDPDVVTPSLPMPMMSNFSNPYPEDYEVELVESIDGYLFAKESVEFYEDMIMDARAEGITIYPVSTYRSYERQLNNYNKSIQSNIDKGMSKEDATRRTEMFIAYPGASEHGLGTTVDFNITNIEFENSDAFDWLQENAVDYGFILRYPKGKEEITRITYEPWHYRFVGLEHAKIIWDENLTLEEYIDQYYPDHTYLPVHYYDENPRD